MKKFKNKDLKNTEFLSKSIITLPIYPDLKNKELNYIFNKISYWLKTLND